MPYQDTGRSPRSGRLQEMHSVSPPLCITGRILGRLTRSELLQWPELLGIWLPSALHFALTWCVDTGNG